MFRYDQNVPNRDEVRPSQNEWTSSSSLLATAVTVGTTWERMSKFWKNKKSIIISALLVTALVGSTCALFIGRSPDKPEVTDGSMVIVDSLTTDHKTEGAPGPDAVSVTSAHQKPKKHHRKHHRQPTDQTTTEIPSTATVKSAVAEIKPATQAGMQKSVASSDSVNNTGNNGTSQQSVISNTPGASLSETANLNVTVSATAASLGTEKTANTTDVPPPEPQNTCDRNSATRKKSLVGAESKPAVSVINEVQEKVDFLIEKCKTKRMIVYRCTVVLLCDGSWYVSKLAPSKRGAKELAARAACEAVY